MKGKILLIASSLAISQFLCATSEAAPVALKLEYMDTSGATDAHASAYLLFSDASYLLNNNRDRNSYWNVYYNDYDPKTGMTFDQWYKQNTGITQASITVETSETNAGDGTFTYTTTGSDTLKDFYWKFTNPSTVDLSQNLLSQLDHFMWMPVVGRYESNSYTSHNLAPHSNDLGDFKYSGDFSINTNDFGCGRSINCIDYGMYGTYPYGKPQSLKLDLVSATVDMNPVPLPAAFWLFCSGLGTLLARVGRKK